MADLTATPADTSAERALHINLVDSVKTAKRGILRASFYQAEIVERTVHRTLGYASGVGCIAELSLMKCTAHVNTVHVGGSIDQRDAAL